MTYFLAKTDPETYSIEDLEKEKKTVWNGVRNPQAVRVIRSMKPGDQVLVYHSAKEAAIVGLMEVLSLPRADSQDAKSWVVDVRFVKKFEKPMTLREIKESHLFDDWNLVYQSRLSTMTVPEKFMEWMKRKDRSVLD